MDEILRAARKCFQPRQWFVGEGEPDPFIINDEDAFMWVYKSVGGDNYEVGFFAPDGQWFVDGVYVTRETAAARVSYLNGGNKGK